MLRLPLNATFISARNTSAKGQQQALVQACATNESPPRGGLTKTPPDPLI
jgi:hypothetical protein